MCEKAGRAPFTETQTSALVRFMDRSGEGDLSMQEVARGFAAIDEPIEAESLEEEIGALIRQVEAVLQDKRLVDSFRELDVAKASRITSAQLKDGLQRLLRPEAFLKARVKVCGHGVERGSWPRCPPCPPPLPLPLYPPPPRR